MLPKHIQSRYTGTWIVEKVNTKPTLTKSKLADNTRHNTLIVARTTCFYRREGIRCVRWVEMCKTRPSKRVKKHAVHFEFCDSNTSSFRRNFGGRCSTTTRADQ